MTDWLLVADAYDCSAPDARTAGLDAAAAAIAGGELVLMPTDTVYGVAADAFTPAAVTGLLAAKNRGRAMPVIISRTFTSMDFSRSCRGTGGLARFISSPILALFSRA